MRISDWSSDVCSSDLTGRRLRFTPASFEWDEEYGGAEGEELNHRFVPIVRFRNRNGISEFERHTDTLDRINHGILQRSEERRVGKECVSPCRSRGSQYT